MSGLPRLHPAGARDVVSVGDPGVEGALHGGDDGLVALGGRVLEHASPGSFAVAALDLPVGLLYLKHLPTI